MKYVKILGLYVLEFCFAFVDVLALLTICFFFQVKAVLSHIYFKISRIPLFNCHCGPQLR